MANNRKVINMQSGNINRAVRERRQYEESLIMTGSEELDKIPSSLFINAAAKKEYFRALKALRESVGIIGNLNRADLLSYANSYGRYTACVKETKKKDFQMVVRTEKGLKANPVCDLMDRSRREMAESARRLGMTVDGMLKAAAAKAQQQEAELQERFGGI